MTKGKLYVVSTPIGNLGDLSKRAADTLEFVDFIAAEDTRVTLKLLNYLGIKKPMISCYRHNEKGRSQEIVDKILAGENCALCSDAGTPAISDPGEELVSLAVDNSIEVVSVPGPCAAIAALSISGIPSGRFCFEGFLSVNKKVRKTRLEALSSEERTMVFYEAPHKLKRTLKDMLSYFGNRNIAISREMTKVYEEVIRFPLSDAVNYYNETDPRGEYVIVVEGFVPENEEETVTVEDAACMANELRSLGVSASEAAKNIAFKTGISKSKIYSEMMKNENNNCI
ncbi:MAG: 16S rRNA (cytidine(1402)-2'-O)-methyltransferase [Ruminococcaceae bacterium]|nr:16S rRNA (cytidine(1402)-2'-O)-methyltransferase [Oscillospiraceae bacterium]